MDASSRPGTGRRSARPTITDVARLAAVDRAVVSKVLSDDPSLRVREETRERVRRAADTLGYRPNFYARGLARARAGALGLLLPEGNPLFTEVMAGAQEVALERDLLLWTMTHQGDLPDRYRGLLLGGVVDALLVAGLRAEVDARTLLAESPVPVILVNRRSRGSERWVILDDERATRDATRHLLGLGHTEIAFLGGPEGVDTAERRRDGFLAAMRGSGATPEPAHIVHADYSPAAGEVAIRSLLRARRRPTAIVAADAPLGLGAWHALDARGIEVPTEMSLIAIHKPPFEEYRVPGLTCVELPLRMLGRRAAELVLDTPADDPIHELVRADTTIRGGGTVAPPARRGGSVPTRGSAGRWDARGAPASRAIGE
ncbi:MAG: LacI family DNA-binding transcriptional regulator [Chloroflexi bacterium]|nr:LacI family DNA-binding transcriptional regulator [Chloroflexota bacterium]